jgi:PhnB protein
MQVQSYLFFEGRCEEAIEFYAKAIGAKPGMLMRMKDAPETPMGGVQPGMENKLLHAEFTVGETFIMASDGMCSGKPNFAGFSLTLAPATEAETDKLFNALADGGQVAMPLSKTFFSPRFGMVTDRFGLSWMVMTQQAA